MRQAVKYNELAESIIDRLQFGICFIAVVAHSLDKMGHGNQPAANV